MKEIPIWMEKYIPSMMAQWFGLDSFFTEQSSDWKIKDVINYRETLSDKSFGFPNRQNFDINMNIKIELLEIINKDFKLDK
jgi:hypothetical protein